MYIESIELTDFRSHHHLALSFVDGVNALIGPSNTGKSNVMRALRWCLTNQPSGTEMIRIGAKEARVTVHLSTGYSIERSRGRTASNNFYRLFKDGELVGEYTGFGQNVPEAIRTAHGMSLDRETSMNFHDQLETAFLVASSASQRAHYIGNLEELAKVDRAASELNQEIRDRSRDAKRLEQDIRALEIEIGRLKQSVSAKRSTRESLRIMLEGLEQETGFLSSLERTLSGMEDIRTRLRETEAVIEDFRRGAEGFPDDFEPQRVNRLFVLAQEAKVHRERLALIIDDAELDLGRLEENHLLVESSLLNTERLTAITTALEDDASRKLGLLDLLSDEVRAVVGNDYDTLDEAMGAYRLLFRHHANLLELKERDVTLREEITSLNEQNERLLDEMLGLLVEAGRCATCGQDTSTLTHDCIEQTI